jgi:hypothetical protein
MGRLIGLVKLERRATGTDELCARPTRPRIVFAESGSVIRLQRGRRGVITPRAKAAG